MWNFQVVSQQRVVSLNRGLFRSVSLCCFFQSQPIIWCFFSKILLLHWHCTIIISPLITGILCKFIFWTIFDLKFNRKSFICLKVIIFFLFFLLLLKDLWSWSYGGWIYNYLCNKCLSPLKLWVTTPFMARCTRYNVMW